MLGVSFQLKVEDLMRGTQDIPNFGLAVLSSMKNTILEVFSVYCDREKGMAAMKTFPNIISIISLGFDLFCTEKTI